MRKILILSLGVFISLSSCKTSNPENPASETLKTSNQSGVELNPKLQAAFGEWIAKGVECYGIVVMQNADGSSLAKSVKAKVMTIKSDQIKLKAIEKVNLMDVPGCDKIGMSYGDTWWETEGDLFRTREEAEAVILSKGWELK